MAGRKLGPVLLLAGLWLCSSWAQSSINDGTRLRSVLSSYTELGSGLQYKDQDGQWRRSAASAESKGDGGLAFNKLPVKYDFAPSANQRAVLTEQHASGSARSAVSALSYYDPASGKSRIFSWVQPAQAQDFDGGVFYPSCFNGVDADIVYKVHPWGLEQDVVLFGDLPLPSDLGLEDETAVLCVWTELLDVDERTAKRPEGVEVSVPSPSPLRLFGQDPASPLYNLQRCYAYVEEKSLTLGGRDRASEQVVNMRLFTVEGRTFLSEEVPVTALLKSAGHLFAKKTDEEETRTVLEVPPLRPEQCREEPRLAQAPSRQLPGYVIDYINYSGTLTNSFTFQSNQTYFISSPLTFDGTNVVLTVEPSCYVKLATNASISFINGARLVTKSHGLTPALFTSVYDTNGAGEVISGYVGNPATNKYPTAFIFQASSNQVQGVRIRYAQCGLRFEAQDSARQEVTHAQFFACDRAAEVLSATNEVVFKNCLFQNLSEGVYANTNAVSILNCTFDTIGQWAVCMTNAIGQMSLRNNLFSAATNQVVAGGPTNALLMAYNAFYCSASNRVGATALLLSNAPFATGLQGAHYLSATSGLVNAGQGSATNWGLYHYTTSTSHTKETNSLVDIGFHYAVSADTDGDGLYDFIEDSNGDGLWTPSLEDCSWTQADTDSDGIPDGAELVRGTNPSDSNSCLITIYVSMYDGGHVPPFLSWANAATTIQAAVDVSYPGDLILVADGFYAAGGRAKPGLRQSRLVIDKPVTVRSVNGPNSTLIRGELPSDSGGPGMRAVYMTNNAVLDGFMIFSGSAVSNINGDLIQDYYGGGVWCEDHSAVLTNCMVFWNEARFGGGLYRGTARNCTLAGNAGHVYGGGAYESLLYDCEVSGNWGNERGGGVYEADMVACSIVSNFSVMGGGMYGGTASNTAISHNTGYWQGGGVDGAATLDQCVIHDNEAVYGGGVYGFGTEVRQSVLSSNQAFQGGGAYGGDFYHCTFRGNRAEWDAGSIWSGLGNCLVVENVAGYNAACSYGAIINCTVADNIATQAYGGAVGCWVINSILYHNTPDNHTESEIHFSCVTPEAPGLWNITNQPAFTDRGQGYHLSLTSACVNAGETYSATSLLFDCDGEVRVFGGVVDMGHDEAVDTDGDGMPDWWELEQGMNPSSGVSSALSGWWKFDEAAGTNVLNSAGTSYNGYTMNMPTNARVEGRLGGALSFDGVDAYVAIPQPSTMITNAPFTISAWAYLEPSCASDYPSIFSDLSVNGWNYMGLWLGYDAFVNGLAGSINDTYFYQGQAVAGRWAHIALSYNGTHVQLYLDGTQRLSQAVASFTPAAQSEIRIGWSHDPNFTYHWKGLLDDVRLYKTALSSNEVLNMYDALQDADDDGLNNLEEYLAGTDPRNPDTDGDGMADGWENLFFGGPTKGVSSEDPDNDGLTNLEEFQHGTNPFSWDTDGDGLNDKAELVKYETDPALYDSKISGMSDGQYKLIGVWDIEGPDLAITAMSIDGGAIRCTVSGTSSESMYELYRTTNSGGSWSVVEDSKDQGLDGTTYLYDRHTISFNWLITGLADDPDGDGLGSAYEWLISRTDPDRYDTDGDGIGDGQEILDDTDPLDKYSVRPPDFLRALGPDIVDESTNRVILKSVNIGGWLAFEQWMLGFEPKIVTNMIGSVTTNKMSEATLRSLLVDNVDFAVTRLATNHNGAHPLLSMNGPGWAVYSHIGSFKNAYWVRYNIDGGAEGVSNMSVIIARGSSTGNPRIEVRLGNENGPHVGTLAVADTGAWNAWSEQTVALWSNVVGVQTVYLVGATSGDDVGNVHLVRFFRDSNTRKLVNTFRDNYFATNDLDRLKDLGYNCLRVPFLADMIMNGTNFVEEGWTHLDWVVSECQRRRMWCILTLHGTPGSQNWEDHSGQPKDLCNRLWNSAEYKKRMSNLWVQVADRYKTNSAVAGYDIMNEPETDFGGPGKVQVYSNSILPVLSTMYSAIRSKDTKHLVFMMSNFLYANMWNDLFACPAPASMGWSNVVYEFHHYDRIVYGQQAYANDWFVTQKAIADDIVRTYARFMEEKQVPVFIGEFMPVKMQNFDYFLRQFEANGIHWANWNFRHFGYDDTRWPWSSWGLDYRKGGVSGGVNPDIQPNIKTDSFEVLSNKLAQYIHTNYVPHPYLVDVVKNTTDGNDERMDFYLNTFNGPDLQSLAAAGAWPWRRFTAIGASDKFWLQNGLARLRLATGPVALRLKSREEADARFETGDALGCWFSVDVTYIHNTNMVVGPEAEIRLAVARDSVTNNVKQFPTPAITALFQYDVQAGSSNAYVCLYSKTNSISGAYGTLLFSNTIAYATGLPLRLYVNASNAMVVYNGTTSSALHGQGKWIGGAVCMLEAQDTSGGGTVYAEVDNLKVWRPDAEYSSVYENDMTAYPSGIYALAMPEKLSIRTWDAETDLNNSYLTNGTLYCIPQKVANGWQFVNPRRDYHNDVRLPMTPTNVVEIRVAYTNFTQGIAKICAMPEYFPGETKGEFEGQSLYVQVEGLGGTQIRLTGFRQWGRDDDGRVNISDAYEVGFVQGEAVTMQLSTNQMRVYYGALQLFEVEHGLADMTTVYANGLFPHYEFQNTASTTAATVQMNKMRSLQLLLFSDPSE